MFSPNVMYDEPWKERSLMTRFVKRWSVGWASVGEAVAATIHCSLRTSCKMLAGNQNMRESSRYQNSNDWVMIWIINIVRKLLYDIKEANYEVIIRTA
jgi:hypothetical protein